MRILRLLRRPAIAGAGLVVAVSALLPGVSAAGTASAAKPKVGGTWTIGITNEVASLDPVRQTVGSLTLGGDRAVLVYGSLLTLNSRTGAVMPGLAEGITSTDAQTWRLKLRPDVKFSDGTPLDADAVLFNLQRFQDPANAFTGRATVNQITTMTKIDATTLEFKLIVPNGSFPIVFTDTVGYMGSPTAIKANPTGFGQKPVGAGAYVLKTWNRDSNYIFERNPNYWDKPRPYIDTIEFKVIPNQTTLAQALKDGTVDDVHVATATDQLPVATADPKNFRAFDPTKVSGGIGVACNLSVAPCNDIRFREAISLAFDFDQAKQIFLAGVTYNSKKLQCMPWGPGSPYCAKDVVAKYNPTKASKLVKEVQDDGINTDITYTFNADGTSGQRQGEWVQQQLQKIGVKVTIRAVSTNEYVPITNNHTFQMAIVYNPPSVDMTSRFYNDWHSVGGPLGGRDVPNLNNAALDVALEKGRNSLKLQDRIDGMQEAQRIIAKEFLVTWTYPQLLGIVQSSQMVLPNYVNVNAPVYRYEEAWIKGSK